MLYSIKTMISGINEHNLRLRQRKLIRQIRDIVGRNLMRGTIVGTRRSCGKPSCICIREGKKHSSRSLSVNLGGKTRWIYLNGEREDLVQVLTHNYRRMWVLLDELTGVNLKLLSGGRKKK